MNPLQDQLAAVRRDVEVAHVEVRGEVGHLALDAALQLDEPQVLVTDLPAQHQERPSTRSEGEVSLAACQRPRDRRRPPTPSLRSRP